MKMIEIDPRVFITCRLCVDSWGVYQIVPSIQEKIKFCYDIEVNPFDGLPQLICKKCESTLSKYASVKNSYIYKQNNLRESLKENSATSLQVTIGSEQETNATRQLSNEKENKGKKKFVIYSTQSDESDIDSSKTTNKSKKKPLKRVKRRKSDFWHTDYERSFICQFCNKCCKSKSDIIKHVNTHSSLLSTYLSCIKRSCYVRLNKVDDKPNICKSEKIVVVGRNRCIKSGHDFYYNLFRPKAPINVNNDNKNSSNVYETHSKLGTCTTSETSDSESEFKRSDKKRPRKPASKSSKATTIVGTYKKCSTNFDLKKKRDMSISSNSKTSDSNRNECINICDYSDSESCKIVSVEKIENNSDLNLSLRTFEFKPIQNIISVCFKKYLKKVESSIESASQFSKCNRLIEEPLSKLESINHKVLSIGRKIINGPGFSCVGVLRYLEHQNLEVEWMPRLLSNIKKPDYVRIMMKLKNIKDNESQDFGWEKLENINHENSNYETIRTYVIKQIRDKNLYETANTISNSGFETNGRSITDTIENVIEVTNTDKRDSDKLLKKLLNENPVANPKQIPKKINPVEYFNNPSELKSTNKDHSVDIENDKIGPNDFQMPIITSTRSLAEVVVKQKASNIVLQSVTNNNIDKKSASPLDSKKNIPRIKVKPVTELMSHKALCNVNNQHMQQVNIVNSNQNIDTAFQNNSFNVGFITEIPIHTLNLQNSSIHVVPNSYTQQNVSFTENINNREFVVMDTVDIPCKRTDSPFKYFKDLLYINNIVLLDVNEKMFRDFVCLLKFKLMFQQESSSPVVLCLALYYSKNRFCIKVKDIKHNEINILQLSANWQWEILKIYRGEIVTKLLENAQKISPEVFYNTNKFLCYLKSINFQKET